MIWIRYFSWTLGILLGGAAAVLCILIIAAAGAFMYQFDGLVDFAGGRDPEC